MNRDELVQALTEIGTIEDVAERRSKLIQVTDEVKNLYTTQETLSADKAKLEADNKSLQEYNMKLYLRVGGQTQTKEPEQETPKELKYDDLFNEKGELK